MLLTVIYFFLTRATPTQIYLLHNNTTVIYYITLKFYSTSIIYIEYHVLKLVYNTEYIIFEQILRISPI